MNNQNNTSREQGCWMNSEGNLTSMMDNVLALRLGRVARTFKDEHYPDGIDAGLVLRRRLEEAGFSVQYIGEPEKAKGEL